MEINGIVSLENAGKDTGQDVNIAVVVMTGLKILPSSNFKSRSIESHPFELILPILTSMCKSDGTNKGFKGMKSPKPLACYFMKSRHRWSNSSARFSPRF